MDSFLHKIVLVGLGGFIGAVLRYGASGLVENTFQAAALPYGTLAVNMAGCFLLGLCAQLVDLQAGLSPEARLFVMVGLLGAFTTYSTFSNETMNLIQDQKMVLALINIGVHVLCGLAAVILGRLAASVLWR